MLQMYIFHVAYEMEFTAHLCGNNDRPHDARRYMFICDIIFLSMNFDIAAKMREQVVNEWNAWLRSAPSISTNVARRFLCGKSLKN